MDKKRLTNEIWICSLKIDKGDERQYHNDTVERMLDGLGRSPYH